VSVFVTATEVGSSVQTSMKYPRIKLHENPTSWGGAVALMHTDRLKTLAYANACQAF